MPEVLISFSWATLARKYPLFVRSVPTMDSATWCRMLEAASAARRLRPEVSKNSSTALSSNEGELARSITTCAPAMASLRPSPVMLLTPVLGEAATTSWPPWRRMATVFEPIRPVPPMTTIFMAYPPLSTTGDLREHDLRRRQLDERGNGKAGVIAHERVRKIVDAARGFSLSLNVRDPAAIARMAIAEPSRLPPLPRRLPHEPS